METKDTNASMEHEFAARPNRVLFAIGWGLGRGFRVVRDGLIGVGEKVSGGSRSAASAGEVPEPADAEAEPEDRADTEEAELADTDGEAVGSRKRLAKRD